MDSKTLGLSLTHHDVGPIKLCNFFRCKTRPGAASSSSPFKRNGPRNFLTHLSLCSSLALAQHNCEAVPSLHHVIRYCIFLPRTCPSVASSAGREAGRPLRRAEFLSLGQRQPGGNCRLLLWLGIRRQSALKKCRSSTLQCIGPRASAWVRSTHGITIECLQAGRILGKRRVPAPSTPFSCFLRGSDLVRIKNRDHTAEGLHIRRALQPTS